MFVSPFPWLLLMACFLAFLLAGWLAGWLASFSYGRFCVFMRVRDPL
jgi:hypothetical protein